MQWCIRGHRCVHGARLTRAWKHRACAVFWAEPANIRTFATRVTVTRRLPGGGVCHLRDPVRVTPAGIDHRWHMPTVSGKLVITKKNCALKWTTYVYFGSLHELHLPNTDDDRFVQRATARSNRPKRAHDTTTITRLSRDLLLDIIARHHHYNITICMEMRRDLMHERCLWPRKLYDSRPR